MKICERVSTLFSDYVENTLRAEDKQELEVHLDECAACRVALDRMGTLRARLQSLTPMQTSEDFETILRARIKLNRTVAHPLRLIRSGMGTARLASYSTVGLLIIFSLTYLLWQHPRRSTAMPGSNTHSTQEFQVLQLTPGSAVSPTRISFSLDNVTLTHTHNGIGSSGVPLLPQRDNSADSALARSSPPPRPQALDF